jgi:hypothetical protein
MQLPLDAFPSVQAVCRGRRLLFTSSFSRQTSSSSSSSAHTHFSDWQQLADSYGAECFLAVPLCFAQQDLGCLLLAAAQPAAVDKYVRKLVIELGLVVTQTLYTLLCMQQMRAGDHIINDMMPQQVRGDNTLTLDSDTCMLAEQPSQVLAQLSALPVLFKPHCQQHTAILQLPSMRRHQQAMAPCADTLWLLSYLPLLPHLLMLSLVLLLQVAEHLRRRLMMARSCSSAAGSCALPRLSMNLPQPQQQQQQFGLAGFGSWDMEQPTVQQQQQQLAVLDAAQLQLSVEPNGNLVTACRNSLLAEQQQQQQQHQQHQLQHPDDGGTELRQQLAWQALQQQQQQQQLHQLPDTCNTIAGEQLAQHALQQQILLPLPQQPSPAASPAVRRLVHSTSGSSSGSGSSGTGMSLLGLPRPIACTNSMQQLIDAAKQAAGSSAGAAADSAAAAAVAYKQWHVNVSVLFADVQGCTELADKVEPEQVNTYVRSNVCYSVVAQPSSC